MKTDVATGTRLEETARQGHAVTTLKQDYTVKALKQDTIVKPEAGHHREDFGDAQDRGQAHRHQ